jgi:ferritin-like metal-binding protein YciE
MKLRSFEDLMVAQLKLLRGAEEQIVETMPKFVKSASSSEAVAGLQAQVTDSKEQQVRLGQIARELGRKLSPRLCDPVAGMLEEMRILSSSKKTDALTLDVALLSAAQRMLRHRMNLYRHARELAEQSGSVTTAELLDEALAEQGKADLDLNRKLAALINPPLPGKVGELVTKIVKPGRPKRPADVVDRLLGVELADIEESGAGSSSGG